MIFFLRKFIEALMLPVGLSGFLVLAGIVFRRRWLSAFGVVVLVIFSAPIVGTWLLRPLELVYAPMTVPAAPTADAIMVLSGGIVRGIAPPGMQWGESSNRYFTGFELAKAGKARFLIFSAATTDDSQGLTQGALLQKTAIGAGIPAERVILTSNVLTTEDEARAVSKIKEVHSILLVTSAFHMPRAVLLFRRFGLDVKPFPTDERTWRKNYRNSTAFIPGSHGLEQSEQALREYYGLAVYKLLFLFRG